ncbi:hypothetical protein [Chromobacterium alticapitis]|uniref:Uncharacterized protein n=1 Tax=Chromobacterium alticapitis TaxID=2073169 RepID=A0A2S5DAW1_9NEIS|nr:hypothetical protein [Chromobacterium alticapitis]POZ60131.1 hypothetical protein C2I19_20590 [Chromobacterium alticapitis]
MPQNLIDEFDQKMHGIYDSALKLKPPYRATYFLQMLGENGGKGTADRLLATSKPSTGFTELFLRGKQNLRLSVEYFVLCEPWRKLFTSEQLAVARKRLRDVECPLPPEDFAANDSGA